jgi:hypothetical protein
VFVGHYGVSFAAKKGDASVPLWVLFVAVQLLDFAWAPLVLLGVEKVRIVPGFTRTNALDLYYMPYTHSLVAAVLWSAAAFAVYRLAAHGGNTAALIVGAAVFSHWVLDFVVHVPDLSLYDDTSKVGLGMWNRPVTALVLEAVVLFGGMWMYFRTGAVRRIAMAAFGFVMIAIQLYVFFGPPPASDTSVAITALAAYVLFAVVVRLIEGPRRGAQTA